MTRVEFENIILPVNRNLYRFAFRLLSSREEAEDAVQEIFLKLWNMREGLDKYRSVEALAMTMCRNHCLDMIRKRGRRDRDEIYGNNGTTDSNPEQLFERGELYGTIIDIVSALPEKFRSVLQLKDIDGLDYEEISEKLEININTLRVNLSRGRKMVREQLIALNYEPSRT